MKLLIRFPIPDYSNIEITIFHHCPCVCLQQWKIFDSHQLWLRQSTVLDWPLALSWCGFFSVNEIIMDNLIICEDSLFHLDIALKPWEMLYR